MASALIPRMLHSSSLSQETLCGVLGIDDNDAPCIGAHSFVYHTQSHDEPYALPTTIWFGIPGMRASEPPLTLIDAQEQYYHAKGMSFDPMPCLQDRMPSYHHVFPAMACPAYSQTLPASRHPIWDICAREFPTFVEYRERYAQMINTEYLNNHNTYSNFFPYRAPYDTLGKSIPSSLP